MRGYRSFLTAAAMAGIALFGASLGCDRHSSDTASGGAMPPAPPAMAVAKAPAAPATRPSAVLSIDGKPVSFPPARLVLTRKPGGLDAVLCSDDPPNAIDPGYLGNSFIFEMQLDVDDPSDLPAATWTYKTTQRGVQDTPDGIFLYGSRRQMQPTDVRVTFARAGDNVQATVAGKFLFFQPHDLTAPPHTVPVVGTLDAMVQVQ